MAEITIKIPDGEFCSDKERVNCRYLKYKEGTSIRDAAPVCALFSQRLGELQEFTLDGEKQKAYKKCDSCSSRMIDNIQRKLPQTAQPQTVKELITSILKCDMQHHYGCLAPDCFICLDSRFQMMMLELFPDEYIKKTAKKKPDVKTYFITGFEKFEKDTRTGSHDTGACRTFGYYNNREEAVNAVLNNACDIRETIYNYVVIDCVYPGLYQFPTEQLFFKWNKDKQAFESIPLLVEHFCSLAIG